MTARCSFDPCAGQSCVWGTILNALRVALRINSGKNIYNFGIAERLRALRYPIFTGGVVEGNGICSAAFCESAALRGSRLALSVTCGDSSPKGRAKSTAGNFLIAPNTLVLNFTAWLPLWGSWRGSA